MMVVRDSSSVKTSVPTTEAALLRVAADSSSAIAATVSIGIRYTR